MKINHIRYSVLSMRQHIPFLWLQATMAVRENEDDAQRLHNVSECERKRKSQEQHMTYMYGNVNLDVV